MHLNRAPPGNGSGGRGSLAFAAACYLLFVVYGSLVPVDFHPRPLDAAWREFLGTRYLELGVGSRADWVANILLYMPLAYLLCAVFAGGARSAFGRLVGVAAAFVVCAAVALGVEFTQLFFPPRTVSLNDILAEFIGTGLGIGVWLVWGGALQRFAAEMERGGLPAIRTAAIVYMLAYLALSLFPYDFLVSAQEYSEKFAKGGYGFLVASETCGRLSACAGKLLAEIVAVVPLGVLLGMLLGRNARNPYVIAALSGLALGFVIEIAQLFIASGISDGVSLLTRAAGFALGVALYRHVRLQSLAVLRPYIGLALLAAIPAYLVALMWANAWFSGGWVRIDQASAKLQEVRWLPFYYHYYTTETHALRSLLAVVAMYLPVGIGYWLWTLRPGRVRAGGSALIPALIAAPLAFVMEMGKLFVSGKQPDPTDVLIAMVAAGAAYLMATRMHEWALQGEPGSLSVAPGESPRMDPAQAAASSGGARVIPAALLLGGAAIAAWNYPLGGIWLALALGSYALVLWRYPGVCLPAVLALLPLLDFSPWSGWILLNEFDLLMLVTLAVRLLRRAPAAPSAALSTGARWAIGLLAASFFASALVGLLPLSPFDQNVFLSYFSSFNSLRHLKGFVWALALLPLLLEEAREPERLDRKWIAGMLAGLCGVLAVVVWERAAFAGLLDFAGEYRAEGPFPELHTGGGDIHAYLVLAIPFVVAFIMLRPTMSRVISGTALFGLASYALAVTFARGGYVGYAGAIGVLGIATMVHWMRQGAWNGGRIAIAAVLGLAGVAVMLPIVSGSFMQARLAGTQTEAVTRTQHWAQAIRMIDDGAWTAGFGMGLGTFPRTVLFKDHDAASATYSYAREGGNGFVRLGSGKPLYLGQRVSVVPGKKYTLALDLRSASPNAAVNVSLCEKSHQQSFRCKEASFQMNAAGTGWQHHEAVLDSEQIGAGLRLLRRPVVLSLANARSASVVDVDNLRLVDEAGKDLVVNGDFSRGGARWFHSADSHLPWHIFNLWVQILFEQGWFGVLAVAVAVAISPHASRRRDVAGGFLCRRAARIALRVSADRPDREPVRWAPRNDAVLPAVVYGNVALDAARSCVEVMAAGWIKALGESVFRPRASIHIHESEHQPADSTPMRACVSSPA